MKFDDVAFLRVHHAAWRLLRADNAPLVLSFLGQVFVEDNARSLPASELESRLEDTLYALHDRLGQGAFPRPPRAYLDDWAAPEQGWLRKFYPADSDEPHLEATPALENAYAWVSGLQARSFVGTESRLHTMVDLLRQIVYGTETDADTRIAELRRRRDELDRQIAAIERGEVPVLDDAEVRDRYQQFATTARDLLKDFREVEDNFRGLDRQVRERIARWTGGKGELLDDILGDRTSITDSDQGRNFQAFYDLLLSRRRQDELADLLDRAHALDAVDARDGRMRHVHHDWLDAAERTQQNVRLLSEQLRRFLDDQVWLENRRVMDILRSIEGRALALREVSRPTVSMDLAAATPTLRLPMERPLYRPSAGVTLDSSAVAPGDADVDVTALFEQVYVDPALLAANVRSRLRGRDQVSLRDVVDDLPVRQGLAEIVGYLALREDDITTVVDEEHRESIEYLDEGDRLRVVTMPRVSYVPRGRRREEHVS